MWVPHRVKHAVDWRLRALVTRLDHLTAEVSGLRRELDEATGAMQAELAGLRERLDAEIRPVLRALAAEEAANRRRLAAIRAEPGYELAWSEAQPLVSITLATRDRAELLLSRALPSLLSQTYTRLEVLVVGDAAAPEVAQAVAGCGDSRVRWANLSVRVEAHPDPARHHLVASTLARNEATARAAGRWLLHFDDDDSLRPDAIAVLLARARETRAEVVYGGFAQHTPTRPVTHHCAFPPEVGQFGWQGALHHSRLPFRRELVAAELGVPGDMWLLERMLRAGVRFAAVDREVWDYFPALEWAGQP